MARIRARLADVYGVPSAEPHGDGLAELVLTVLSQSTNDRNRDVAFLRLRERFPSWEAVRDAPLEEIEEAIRPGGISKVKSARIQAILRAIGDPLDLGWMRDAPVAESQAYLCALPGVGRKTAACVLLFAFGLRDVPVDTHVSRVGMRLGPAAPEGAVRGAARRDARADAAGRRARAARQPAAPRAAHVPRAAAGLRGCALRRMCPSRRDWRADLRAGGAISRATVRERRGAVGRSWRAPAQANGIDEGGRHRLRANTDPHGELTWAQAWPAEMSVLRACHGELAPEATRTAEVSVSAATDQQRARSATARASRSPRSAPRSGGRPR